MRPLGADAAGAVDDMTSSQHHALLMHSQVLVRLKFRPVHPADLMAVAGRHIIRPPPFVPGSEVRLCN